MTEITRQPIDTPATTPPPHEHLPHEHRPHEHRPHEHRRPHEHAPADTIGWVADRPVPRVRLDRRLADLRGGPLSATLPRPGTSEDRQLARWLTQVILTECLCEWAATALGAAIPEHPLLDPVAAVELGSINAAAYNANPWVRAVFEHVTATVTIPSEWRSRPASEPEPRHLVRHRLFPDRAQAQRATPADLEPLGAVTLESLPSAIADALRRHPDGTLTGPVEDTLGWHVAIAVPEPRPDGEPTRQEPDLLRAAQRKAFARWLDDLRAKKVRLMPGLEHPGDPRQPDNHHKH
ncbi:peptidylprolyl isomerase [Nonomuraea rubra]|uniref:peptidylprolyl isomerase n=1 Tax=Nonomuraea rubra TaxID=46180 RepID=UPI0033F3AD1F